MVDVSQAPQLLLQVPQMLLRRVSNPGAAFEGQLSAAVFLEAARQADALESCIF